MNIVETLTQPHLTAVSNLNKSSVANEKIEIQRKLNLIPNPAIHTNGGILPNEDKKIRLKIVQNKESLKLSYSDLPESFQKELHNDCTDDLCIVTKVFLKIIQLSFEITSKDSIELQELLKHLNFLPCQIFHLFKAFYHSKNSVNLKKFNFLKIQILRLLDEIKNTLPKVIEVKQKLLNRIYLLLYDLNENLIIDKKPIFLNIKSAHLINVNYHSYHNIPLEALNLLQKKINNAFKFFSCVYKNFLEDNTIFSENYQDFKDDWSRQKAIFTKIKNNFSKLRKRNITFSTCQKTLRVVDNYLQSFVKLSLVISSRGDENFEKAISKEPILDYEKYYNTFGISENNNFIFNSLLFQYSMKFVRYYIIEIGYDVVNIGNSYCIQNNLKLSKKEMKILFDQIQKFILEINKINITFETKSFTPNGISNGNIVFTQINNVINSLQNNWEIYVKTLNPYLIGTIYYDLYWFQKNINETLIQLISNKMEQIIDLKEMMESLSPKQSKIFKSCQKKLESSLNNIYLIKTLLEDYYAPIDKKIDLFEEIFLKKKKLNSLDNSIEAIPEVKDKEIKDEPIDDQNDSIIDSKDKSNELKSHKIEGTQIEITSTQKIINLAQKDKKQSKNSKIEIKIDEDEDFNGKLSLLKEEIKKKSDHKSIFNVKFFELVQEVTDHGFRFVKKTGSHVKFKNPNHPEISPIIIPEHSKGTLSPGIVKQVRAKIYQE